MGDLFRAPTIAALAEHVRGLAPREALPIPRLDDDATIPLSFSQEQVWLHQQAAPAEVHYNEPLDITIPEVIEVDALERALDHVVARHEALRLRLDQGAARPVQRIADPIPARLQYADLRHLPQGRAAEHARRLATDQAARPFDLAREPPLRCLLVRFEQALFRLYLAGHHLALDGVSMFRVFLPELREAYRALVKGEEPRLPPLPHRYRDPVAAQRSRADAWAPELAYWADRLAGLAPLDLPSDRPRGPDTSFAGARVVLDLPADLTSRVRSLARRAGASTFHVLFAAFQTLLRRYVGQDDIAVATVVAGRDVPGLDRHVGDLLNTLILRTNVPLDARFLDVLARTKATCEEAIAHQDAPFQLVVRHARLGADRPGDAPVRVAFVLEPEGPADAGGWEMNQLEIHTGTSKFDLTMELDERRGGVIGRVEYRTDLFDRATIERLIGDYELLLEGIVEGPEARIDDLRLLRDDERERVVRAWNDTTVSLDGPRLLHAFVERAARRWPDAPAIADARGVLDFAALERASNRLAHRLVALGARRDERIAVWTERTGAHVIAQVAILKAGAAFVPLTPAEPIARARTILEDAGVRIVVHDDAHASALEGTDLVAVSVEPGAHVDQPDTPPDVAIQPDDLAYVIYTSGSTGKPKGAAITHGAVAARTEWEAHQLCMRPGDFALHLSAYGFDGAFTATFWSFAAGAGAVIPSRAEIQDAGALVALCRRFRVTGAFTTPALWKLLAPPFAAAGVRLAWAMAGGERVTGELLDRLKAVASRVFNVYGPTEATIMATGWEAPLGEAAASRADPPIGAPIGNVTTYILDERLRPVPIGVPGELFIGGPTLARGYLGRPDLDARAFVADPLIPTGRGRLYRTGDCCRWLPTGDIDFLGRRDDQVKLRGYRIELGEIEAALEADARVDACAVVLRADGGQPRLVAYVAGPGAGDVAGLRERLAAELPAYMIPAAIVPLPALPLTSNGKVDRRALPAPTADRQGSERRVAAPRTDFERRVLSRFRAVLHDEGVGIDDDFFAVGGDSLRAMEMVARAAEEGLALTMRDVLRHRTVAAIAGAMRGREDADPSAPRAAREPAPPATERRAKGRELASACGLRSSDGLVPFREEGVSPPFFCVHPAGGSATCYRALAEHLPGRAFYGLECVESYREETVESLAAGHLARVREVQPAGPYLFGGWSFGGVVAFEMARQVEAAGGRVGLVALLDSRPTTNAHQYRFLRYMNDDSAAILALIGRHLATMAGRANPFDYATLRALPEVQRRPWFLAQLASEALVPAALVDGFAARFIDDFALCHAILRAYRPAALRETDLLLLRATAVSDPYPGFPAMEVPVEEDPDLSYGWKDLTKGRTTVKTVGATHETIVFAPHVRRVGALLADALRDAVREPSTFARGEGRAGGRVGVGGRATRSVPVVLGLERPLDRHAEVVGLVLRQLGQLHAELRQVEGGDLLVELLRQEVHAEGELLVEEGDLREHLVGERAAHHERGVARRAAEVHEPAAGEDDEALAVGEDEVVHLRLDVLFLDLGVLLEPAHLHLGVEVADVAEDGLVLHRHHVLAADDVLAARGGDEDVAHRGDRLHRLHLVALHRRLERADGVDLGDDHARAEPAERLRAALAHVAVPAHDGDLAREHHVRRPLDAVAERLAAAVEVVELALGHRVVDVDGRHLEAALPGHIVEAVYARRRLLGDAADRVLAREEVGVLLVHGDGEVTPVVEDHVGALLALEGVELLLDAPVVLLERLALPGEDRDAGGRDCGGGVVLRRVDVAARPRHLGAQLDQGLDEHRGLDGHVQAARDARAGERLLLAVLGAEGHEARHLLLGDADLLAPPLGERDVGDLVLGILTHGSFSSRGAAPASAEPRRTALVLRNPTRSCQPRCRSGPSPCQAAGSLLQ